MLLLAVKCWWSGLREKESPNIARKDLATQYCGYLRVLSSRSSVPPQLARPFYFVSGDIFPALDRVRIGDPVGVSYCLSISKSFLAKRIHIHSLTRSQGTKADQSLERRTGMYHN